MGGGGGAAWGGLTMVVVAEVEEEAGEVVLFQSCQVEVAVVGAVGCRYHGGRTSEGGKVTRSSERLGASLWRWFMAHGHHHCCCLLVGVSKDIRYARDRSGELPYDRSGPGWRCTVVVGSLVLGVHGSALTLESCATPRPFPGALAVKCVFTCALWVSFLSGAPTLQGDGEGTGRRCTVAAVPARRRVGESASARVHEQGSPHFATGGGTSDVIAMT